MILGLVSATPVVGQMGAAEELTHFLQKYPSSSIVTTRFDRSIKIQVVDDTLQVNVEQHRERLVLRQPASWSQGQAFANDFRRLDEIEAYTLVPRGKKYKKINVEEFYRSYDEESRVFYDDTELVRFTFPEVTIGAKLVTIQRWTVTDPRLISQFFFQLYEPIAQATFSIDFPEQVDIGVSRFGDHSDSEIVFEEVAEKDGRRQYIFRADNMPALPSAMAGLSLPWVSPSVYSRIVSFRLATGEEIGVLGSLHDLHDWYQQFLQNVAPRRSLSEFAGTLVNDDDTDLEKIRKIYHWVQRNVRYVAFADGMRGFIPHPADYVLEKRYGDCKDMTSLLIGLLDAEGISAQFTWVGTRDLPYRYSELPSPLVDNHMIASVDLGDSILFLDATEAYLPYGLPSSMTQGKEALISKGDTFEIVQIPEVSLLQNQVVDTVFLQIKGPKVLGKGTVHFTGLARVDRSEHLPAMGDPTREEYLAELLGKGNNRFELTDVLVIGEEDHDLPMTIEYSFEIEDYVEDIGNDRFANLHLDQPMSGELIKERESPLAIDHRFMHRSVVVLDVPSELEVAAVPADDIFRGTDFGFSIRYILEGPRLSMSREFYVNTLLLTPDRFGAWNAGIDKYSRALRQSLAFKEIVE